MAENDEIKEVVEDLQHAKHELEEARAAEKKAEDRIERDIERLEEIEHEHPRESKIIVNGRKREVPGDHVSFAQLGAIVYPSGPAEGKRITITFRNADQVPAAAELDEGQSVKVKPGHEHDETIFNVTQTTKS